MNPGSPDFSSHRLKCRRGRATTGVTRIPHARAKSRSLPNARIFGFARHHLMCLEHGGRNRRTLHLETNGQKGAMCVYASSRDNQSGHGRRLRRRRPCYAVDAGTSSGSQAGRRRFPFCVGRRCCFPHWFAKGETENKVPVGVGASRRDILLQRRLMSRRRRKEII